MNKRDVMNALLTGEMPDFTPQISQLYNRICREKQNGLL